MREYELLMTSLTFQGGERAVTHAYSMKEAVDNFMELFGDDNVFVSVKLLSGPDVPK